MVFNVSGKITLKGGERAFTKKVEAKSEADAKHKTYALFGSTNGVKRNKIKIEKVEKG
ncbi:50S ribosomal protein L18Ae [Candidatus Bilamarchaeum dharawalense]|uniref:Large ribosomal subunit protein eL20 n=1 Tax=Candidatus Bilamarchaeum dharawalense TaxID=2885759 RepID=A0A5E4LLD9_9ARCH|nr:50S ribosomal protein L18Ae [Candidatus Bilamarchaeum dharawalense]